MSTALQSRTKLLTLSPSPLRLVGLLLASVLLNSFAHAQDFFGCGGFVKSDAIINFSLVEVKLYTQQGALKYSTDCAPNNGYYLIPVYDKGSYVIKVESQSGWSFTPRELEVTVDGSTDPCSLGEDINFRFEGIAVDGGVISAGDEEGPEGVVVSIRHGDELVASAVTDATGRYSFASLLPGDYVISASREGLVFSRPSFPVTITTGLRSIDEKLVVAGYDVKGRVVSEGEPIKDVKFVLHSAHGVFPPEDCMTNTIPPTASHDLAASDLKPLCFVSSGVDGTFVFSRLPNGRYAVVPHYVGQSIRFDVLPPSVSLEIRHAHRDIEEVFRVEGFTVQGIVRVTPSGTPVAGASISLDGSIVTSTNDEGVYKLENIKTGTYTIAVRAPEGSGYYFSPTKTKITPNTPLLPEILPNEFDVCGQISLREIPVALTRAFATQPRRVTFTREDNFVTSLDVTFDRTVSEFCTKLAPGRYSVTPDVTDEENGHGFILNPTTLKVVVDHEPVRNVQFNQAMGSIDGVIKCLGACQIAPDGQNEGMRVTISPVATPEVIVEASVQKGVTNEEAVFRATDILPGNYNVSVVKGSLCWTEEWTLVSASLPGDAAKSLAVFTQSGFRLSCDISHDTSLDFELEREKETAKKTKGEVKPLPAPTAAEEKVGSFHLVKGLNRFCLSDPGVYSLMPKSDCHRFEQNVYRFDTSASSAAAPLNIAAVTHALDAEIHTDVETPDLSATVTSLNDDSSVTLGPLILESRSGDRYVYKLRHWGRHGDSFKITPTAGKLLFKPESVTTTIKADDGCQAMPAVIMGTEGVFISGLVTPPSAGVKVVIIPSSTEPGPDQASTDENADVDTKKTENKIAVETDENGRYSVGPLDGSTTYSVIAKKENFVLTPDSDNPYNFKAFKLGEIMVQVLDSQEEDKELPGVLLSLSGGQGYRSNNMTNDQGALVFTRLSPGQYFLRPMKKEYEFEPPNQMIDVAEGTTVNLKMVGRRVAFSIYGVVKSLNGEGESAIAVEALGSNNVEGCRVSQEEAKTDSLGVFRVRGLSPGCHYNIRVKSAAICPGNGLLERTTPEEIKVSMPSRDLYNFTFIALRKMKDMDVSGNVQTSLEFVTSLKAKLCHEENEDSPVHTVLLGQVPFFFFPSIPIDDRKYVIVLESNLPRHRYEYPDSMKLHFVANRPFAHFSFTFSPTFKPLDAELSMQGNGLFTFPVILLLILAAYYHASLLSYGQALMAWVSIFIRQSAAGATAASASFADEPPRRKRKAFKDQ